MSSELESIVTSIVDNNYTTLVILTAVGYDYILTFPDELEYVWNAPWTRVSTLFILVCYFGLCGITIFSLVGSSFLPVPVMTYVLTLCKILAIFGGWMVFSFVAAADLAMALRVWAMYARSRIILGILLVLCALEIVLFAISSIKYSIKPIVVTAQVLDFSFCVAPLGSPTWAAVFESIQFLLAATMFLLVSFKFVQDSFQMYKMANNRQPSRYMNLFAREGVLYFLAVLFFALVNILEIKIAFTGWRILPVGIFGYVPVFTLAPRLILSMRALYARDLRGWRGTGDMDTWFGLSSAQGGAAIVFADVPVGWEEEDEGTAMSMS